MYTRIQLIAVVVAVCAISLTSSQKRRLNSGNALGFQANNRANVLQAFPVVAEEVVGGTQARSQSTLNVGESIDNAQEAKLAKAARRQARLDKKAARQARKNKGAQLSKGEQLATKDFVNLANYENAANFDNTDAAAAINSANKFGLVLTDEGYHNENSALSKKDGSQAQSAFRIAAAESIDAADEHHKEFIDEAEVSELDAVSAAAGDESILNAAENIKHQKQAQIQAQEFANFFENFGQTSGNGFFGSNLNFGVSNGVFGGR